MHILLLTALLAKAATKSKSSSSPTSLLFIVVIVVAVYFLFLRPRSRRARQQQQSKSNLQIGDEVVSAGGILGRVTNIVDDEVEVEVAPGMRLTFWRKAVNLRSSVSGAPQSAPVDAAPPPDGHYGIEDRYDDEADASMTGDDDHYDVEDDDGARYGVEEPDGPTWAGPATNGPDPSVPPPAPYPDPTLDQPDEGDASLEGGEGAGSETRPPGEER